MPVVRNQDKLWSLYMIRCADHSLYTGISNDVAARFAVHQMGGPRSAKYLRGRHPIKLAFTAAMGSKAAACRAEHRIKKLPKQKKEQIVSGHLSLVEVGIFPAPSAKHEGP